MRTYNYGYQYQDDMDDENMWLSDYSNPDPDDASWNPGNLDTHNADEESAGEEQYDENVELDNEDYDEEEDL